MLSLLCVWLFLTLVSFPVGAALVHVVGCRPMPGPWTALWVGFFMQTLLLQIVAAFFPLYPAAFFVMPAVALIACVAGSRTVWPSWARVDRGTHASFIGVCIIALSVAYIVAGPILYYDTGLYHIQFMRWIARDGLVPGLDLLEMRLGIPTDWFAIAAPFDSGPFQGRMAAAANGYVVVLMATQALFCGQRVLIARASAAETLLAVSFTLLIGHALWTDSADSAAPDLPVAALTIFLGALLVDHSEARDERGSTALGRCCLIAFLAAMAVAIKFSAAPLLAVGVLFCSWRLRHSLRALIVIGVIVAAVLAPTIYTGFVLNGCPAFPLVLGCSDLPWRLPTQELHDLQQAITQFARSYIQVPEDAGRFGWIVPYFIHPGNRDNPPLVLLALLSIAAFGVAGVVDARK